MNMKKIIKLYILFFSVVFFNAQIRLEIKADNLILSNTKNVVQLNIINETDSKYAVPINMTDFKPFFQGDNCKTYVDNSFMGSNDLFLKLVFIDADDNYVDKIFNTPNPSIIHSNNKIMREFEKKQDSAKSSYNRTINDWIKKYNIKKSKSWAEINKIVFPNIIYLGPRQTITYKIYINPSKLYSTQMHQTGSYFCSYYLENNTEYKFLLKYCIDSNVYNYLTKDQKNKLKDYILFSGNLETNLLKWNTNL